MHETREHQHAEGMQHQSKREDKGTSRGRPPGCLSLGCFFRDDVARKPRGWFYLICEWRQQTARFCIFIFNSCVSCDIVTLDGNPAIEPPAVRTITSGCVVDGSILIYISAR